MDAQAAAHERGLFLNSADLAKGLPAIGESIASSMSLLAQKPTLVAANQLLAQLNGALAYVQHVRSSLT